VNHNSSNNFFTTNKGVTIMSKRIMAACGLLAAIAVPLTTFAFIIFLFSAAAYSTPGFLFKQILHYRTHIQTAQVFFVMEA
jgi:hypothetical protein